MVGGSPEESRAEVAFFTVSPTVCLTFSFTLKLPIKGINGQIFPETFFRYKYHNYGTFSLITGPPMP